MLEINTKKTKEIVFGSPSDSHIVPIVINNKKKKIKQVLSYRYVGVVIKYLLSWKDHIKSVCKMTKQRVFPPPP